MDSEHLSLSTLPPSALAQLDHRNNESLLNVEGGRRYSFMLSPEPHLPRRSSDRSSSAIDVKGDERMYGTTVFWIDYFNNLKKCWEPFIEKIDVSVQYEKVSCFGLCQCACPVPS